MAATIDFPDTQPSAFAVFAHCFAGTRHTPGASRIAKRLTDVGIATLRFDFPGLGQSEGDFGDTSFSTNVDDIEAAAAWLADNYSAPQLAMGHSLGGAATLAAASRIPSLRCVATVGAPFDPAHSVLHYADKIGEADANGEVEVILGGRALTISRTFLEDLADTNPEYYLPQLRKPLMILHSPIDTTVGIDNAQNIFLKTRYPKSLVSLVGADHLLTRPGAATRAADLIGAWALQFIEDERVPDEVADNASLTHVVIGTRYGVVARTNNLDISVDRARNTGGRGQGVTAEGLLVSAIAAGSTQSIQETARSLKVQLADAAVSVVHIEGSTFERRITVTGSFTDEQRLALLQAGRASTIDGMLAGAKIVDVD